LIFRYLGREEDSKAEPRRGVNGRLHFTRRPIDVAAQIELERDHRGSHELLDVISVMPRDARELLLERSGDRRRHHIGTGPRQPAVTMMVGKSTSGNAETGKSVYPIPPASVAAASS